MKYTKSEMLKILQEHIVFINILPILTIRRYRKANNKTF